MTLMAFLLMIILFLTFFIYFSGMNPQDITIFYFGDQSLTTSVAIMVVGCVLFGLMIGYAAHLYGVVLYWARHAKQDRQDKKAREVGSVYRDGVNRLLAGDLKKAQTLLQRALERDPGRVESYIALANLAIQEGNPQEGINLLIKAKTVDPKSMEVLFKLASTYEELDRNDEAIEVWQSILLVEGDNRKALRALRNLQIKHGLWNEALKLQRKVMKAGPGRNRLAEEQALLRHLRYELARQALDAGEQEQAKKEFKEIIKEDEKFVPARVSLGDAYRKMGRPDDAFATWRGAYLALGKSIFLSRIEDLYMDAEDPSTLLDFYRNLANEFPDDLLICLFFGKFCLRLEMVDEAMEQLGRVESAGIDTPQLHQLMAEVHRRRNRADEAINEYQLALGIDNRLRLNYLCEECDASTPEWQSRCPACGHWGTYSLAGRALLREAKALQVREIHHGERR
ncbi:MAG: tetratricopeptide repeat protein [Desulfuromonadales bacterium]|nr:tetratricopeptide repeat protein [Desulfuromonadales bacterium]MDT8423781.1 tetratricopeptide repeat protein [Desulfuromonadales bacterium]